MKVRTVYEADDGRRFDDIERCIRYEHDCADIADAMMSFKPRPEQDMDFANGGGYIQQPDNTELKKTLMDIAKRIFNLKEEQPYSIEYITRIANDCDHHALNNALWRVHCTDKQNREWGQPYFAMNPEKGKNIEL